MQFGWINFFGAAIVALMLVPNVVYALKNKGGAVNRAKPFVTVFEQIGRYACIVLMWLPLLVWEFGFPNEFAAIAYFAGDALLLAAYWIVYAFYFKKQTASRAIALAVLPACIFLLSGLLLRHWLLVGFAVLFAGAHIYVTLNNAAEEKDES